MTDKDRQRLHYYLDLAIDSDEDEVITQFASLNLEWHLDTIKNNKTKNI